MRNCKKTLEAMAMKYSLRTAFAIIICVFLAMGSAYAQNGHEKKRKDTDKYLKNAVIDRQNIVVDSDLLDVYVRIMRYQTAWQDLYNKAHGDETTPDDYLQSQFRM